MRGTDDPDWVLVELFLLNFGIFRPLALSLETYSLWRTKIWPDLMYPVFQSGAGEAHLINCCKGEHLESIYYFASSDYRFSGLITIVRLSPVNDISAMRPILSLILFSAITMNAQCYQILTFSELKNCLDQENRSVLSCDLQLKTNFAHIYYLKSGGVVMLASPLKKESKGVLFDSKQCFFVFLNKDHFPIQNERPSILEGFQDDVVEINVRIDTIISYLRSLPDISAKNHQQNEPLGTLLSTLKANFKKLSRTDSFYTALVLGEYIRRTREGKWVILKRYGTFNPYFTPAILYPDGTVALFWDYLGSYFEHQISLHQFMELPWINDPKLKLNSAHITNSYVEYKIL